MIYIFARMLQQSTICVIANAILTAVITETEMRGDQLSNGRRLY